MKILNALAASGTLLLIAALPAAGQPISLHASDASIQLAADGEFGAKRDEYMQRSRNELQEWQRKLHDFSEKAEAMGHDAGVAAKRRLREAWAKTESESRKLEAASADGWESAKSSFETASQKLKDAWQEIYPEGK